MNKVIKNIESIDIPYDKYPKDEEYKEGEVLYIIRNYNYTIRDTPLKDFGVTITCDGVRPTE